MLPIGTSVLLISCLLIAIRAQAIPAGLAGTVDPSSALHAIQNDNETNSIINCSCGVFLSGQFVRGSPKPPVGYPPITSDVEEQLPCTSVGANKCKSKCIDNLIKYLGKGAEVICVSADRDIFKERAHLFIKHCNGDWTNTYLSAGKEYCCKSGEPYTCPM